MGSSENSASQLSILPAPSVSVLFHHFSRRPGYTHSHQPPCLFQLTLSDCYPSYRTSRAQDMSDLASMQERWDVYYRQYLLHSCMHHECVWMDGMWYFPEPGRRNDTLHMFAPSRWGPMNDFKYYDFHLPNGTMIEQMAWYAPACDADSRRYVGNGDRGKEWLQDYVAYDLNMVTVDMVVVASHDAAVN